MKTTCCATSTHAACSNTPTESTNANATPATRVTATTAVKLVNDCEMILSAALIVPFEDYSCMDVDICHVNATCVLDPRTNKHVCSCNEGYEGDGTTCYSRGDCQTDSQCGRNAQCVYEASTRLYRCVCNQGFRGDGRLCEDDQGSVYSCKLKLKFFFYF